MGYDTRFLGIELAFPDAAGGAPALRRDYTHFSIALDRARRLARVTAVNIDGERLVELPRAGIRWRLDPELPAEAQAGAAVYRANDLDRGHLVRRADPVWGEDAEQANRDTFLYPNAAPQASGFNQSKGLWLGLEDHVLGYARAERHRISVFTAPVLGDDDPPYRGIRVPLRFWKVAAWASGGALASAGFLLEQQPVLARAPTPGEPPPLGPFRTYQVPVAEIASITGLDLDPLVHADRLPRAARLAPRTPLARLADVVL